ncbi:MAG TPA: hypothetical protein PKI34_05980 [Bacteroidales bacterium]|nr:hypothetical protein [Bacteroidales bacterium]
MTKEEIITKIDELVKDSKTFKIGMTGKKPSERLEMPDYKDKFDKIIPICSSSNERSITDLENQMIDKFSKLYPKICKNDQSGGGEMEESSKYFLYVVLNK